MCVLEAMIRTTLVSSPCLIRRSSYILASHGVHRSRLRDPLLSLNFSTLIKMFLLISDIKGEHGTETCVIEETSASEECIEAQYSAVERSEAQRRMDKRCPSK